MLGFPLYYCFENEVSEFLHDILVEFDEVTHQNEQIVSSKFDCSAYPNPFFLSGNSRNSELTISYEISKENPVTIDIFNIKVQSINKLEIQNPKLGVNKIIWDGKDKKGSNVSSGIYFYRLKSGSQEKIKKILVFK